MGYEKFVKKIFPFIGNKYSLAEEETSPEEGSYVVDGKTYAFKNEFAYQLVIEEGAEDESTKVFADWVAYKNDKLVGSGLVDTDHDEVLFNILDLVLMPAEDINEHPENYIGVPIFIGDGFMTINAVIDNDIKITSVDVDEFVGYPPYPTQDEEEAYITEWTAETLGLKDIYVEINDFQEMSFRLVFYYNK